MPTWIVDGEHITADEVYINGPYVVFTSGDVVEAIIQESRWIVRVDDDTAPLKKDERESSVEYPVRDGYIIERIPFAGLKLNEEGKLKAVGTEWRYAKHGVNVRYEIVASYLVPILNDLGLQLSGDLPWTSPSGIVAIAERDPDKKSASRVIGFEVGGK